MKEIDNFIGFIYVKSLFITTCIFFCFLAVAGENGIMFKWNVGYNTIFRMQVTENEKVTTKWNDKKEIETVQRRKTETFIGVTHFYGNSYNYKDKG